MGSASAERFTHYTHEIDPLLSLERAECFALEEKTLKKSYQVVQKLLVYETSVSVGFKCTK